MGKREGFSRLVASRFQGFLDNLPPFPPHPPFLIPSLDIVKMLFFNLGYRREVNIRL